MKENALSNKRLREPYPLINLEKRFILFTNAKCGGTTLKSWFVDSLNLERTFSNTFQAVRYFGLGFTAKWYKYRFLNHDLEKIKSSNAYLRKFIKIYRKRTLSSIKKHLNDPNFMRIVVVRNPYDRLVSGYVDKFCGEDLNRSWVQSVIKEIDSKDAHGNYQISFAQFVDYLHKNDLIDVNPHWRHQSYILEHVKLDRIIQLKDMSNTLPNLSEELGFSTNINFNKRRQSNSYSNKDKQEELSQVYNMTNTEIIKFKEDHGYFPSKDTFYNSDIKEKVKKIYQDDFNAFNF